MMHQLYNTQFTESKYLCEIWDARDTTPGEADCCCLLSYPLLASPTFHTGNQPESSKTKWHQLREIVVACSHIRCWHHPPPTLVFSQSQVKQNDNRWGWLLLFALISSDQGSVPVWPLPPYGHSPAPIKYLILAVIFCWPNLVPVSPPPQYWHILTPN